VPVCSVQERGMSEADQAVHMGSQRDRDRPQNQETIVPVRHGEKQVGTRARARARAAAFHPRNQTMLVTCVKFALNRETRASRLHTAKISGFNTATDGITHALEGLDLDASRAAVPAV